jgi:hypothetical protein
MNRNRKRLLAGLAATSVVSAGLAAGGVALASTSSATAPAATTAATATPASGTCVGALAGLAGPWAGRPAVQAAGDYLGLTQAQLRAQLESGKSLADIASARNKPVSGLKNAILAAATSSVNASTWLSAAGKAAVIAEVKSHLDVIVNATFPGGPGFRPMGGRPWGPGWPAGPMGGL